MHNVLNRVSPEPPDSTMEGPGLERAITLTDAIVAIAMTILVLPLVEAVPDVDPYRPGAFLDSHRDLLLSFVISFLVIHVFWAAHGAAIRRLTTAEESAASLRPLNMCWLLVIVFLPFPTAVVGRELTTSSASLYIGTMVVLSALTSCIVSVVDHHVDPPHHAQWAWLTTAVFTMCALISVSNPGLGLETLLLLAFIRVLEVSRFRQRRRMGDHRDGYRGAVAHVSQTPGNRQSPTADRAATPIRKEVRP